MQLLMYQRRSGKEIASFHQPFPGSLQNAVQRGTEGHLLLHTEKLPWQKLSLNILPNTAILEFLNYQMVTLHMLVINCVSKSLKAALLDEQPVLIFCPFFSQVGGKSFYLYYIFKIFWLHCFVKTIKWFI